MNPIKNKIITIYFSFNIFDILPNMFTINRSKDLVKRLKLYKLALKKLLIYLLKYY